MSNSHASETLLPPFGWYPDPAGTAMLRWWDGEAWTDRLERRRPEVQSAITDVPTADWRRIAS